MAVSIGTDDVADPNTPPRVSGRVAAVRYHGSGELEQNEMVKRRLTAIIAREGPECVALCPELDIASQGETIEEARHNLLEAIELFFLSASESEIQSRLHDEVYVTQLEVCVG